MTYCFQGHYIGLSKGELRRTVGTELGGHLHLRRFPHGELYATASWLDLP